MSVLIKFFLCSAVLFLLASSPVRADDIQYGPFGTEDPFSSSDPFGNPESISYDLYGGPLHEDNAITDEYQEEDNHEPYQR